MKPLQVWLPWLGASVGAPVVSRDIQRAFREWSGHDVLYLLPGLRDPERWQLPMGNAWMRCGAVPAEHQDAITIFHVGPNGYVFAPFHPRALHGYAVGDLLNRWLNLKVDQIRMLAAVPIVVAFPGVAKGKVARRGKKVGYERVSARPAPGPAFPMDVVGDADDGVEIIFRWPPEDTGLPSVHPDAESTEIAGNRISLDINGTPGVIDVDTGEWNPHIMFVWPEPFDQMIGPLAGFDPFHAREAMRSVATMKDRAAALAKAKTLATPYVSPGVSTCERAQFWPTALQVHRPGEEFKAFWEPLGIDARTFEDALGSKKLWESIPVVRAWGGIGLMWALLIERLESEVPIRVCPRCGTFLGGRRKVCGKEDNPACLKGRRAEDQRRSRRSTGSGSG
jgi:hypothetical protein